MSVLISGTVAAPRLFHCRSVLLSDPQEPRSKQPYHAVLDLPGKESAVIVRELRKIVAAAAKRSVADLLKCAAEAQLAVRGAALVVGSIVDPASLHNDHIRAHAQEGQLFRSALEDAFRAHNIRCQVLVEKTAYVSASAALHKTPADAKRIIAGLGETHEGS